MLQKASVLFFLLLVQFSLAQTHCKIELDGHLFDEHTKSGIAFANVIISDSVTAYTNDKGHFIINDLCPGKQVISITYGGDLLLKDTLLLNKSMHIDFPVELHKEMLEAVEIESEKASSTDINTELVNTKEKGITQNSLSNQLDGVSGVNSKKVGNNAAKPMILGHTGSRVLIMQNGLRLETQSWGDEHAPEIDPFSGANLEVLTGVQAQRYGNSAIGGVILLSAPEFSKSKIGGSISSGYNTNGRGTFNQLSLSGTLGQKNVFRYSFQGNYSRSGNQKTPSYYLQNTGQELFSWSGLVEYEHGKFKHELSYGQFRNELGVFSGAHIGNLTDLNNAIERGEPITENSFSYEIQRPFQDVFHHYGKYQLNYDWNKNNETQLLYGWQQNIRKEFDADRTESLRPELDLDLTTNTLEILHKKSFNELHQMEFGYFGRYQTNLFSGRYFIPNYALNNHALFTSYLYQHKGSRLKIGGRFDHQNMSVYFPSRVRESSFYNEFNNATASAEWSSHVWKHLSYVLAIGNAWRAPDVNELFSDGVHHGSASYEIGNENLTSEIAYNGKLGIKYLIDHKYVVATQFSYTYFDNYIYLVPTLQPTLTIRGSFPTFRYEGIQANFYNLNSWVKGPIYKGLKFKLQHDFIRAYEAGTGAFLVNIPPSRYQLWLTYQQKSITVEWHSNYTAKQWLVDPALDYAPIPDAYWINHFAVKYSKEYSWGKINTGVQIQNAFNQVYRDYLNRFRYFAHETGRAILINVSYQWR